MSISIEAYRPIVGTQFIDELYRIAEHLNGRTIQHINSTPVGGGVAEILHRLVPLMNEIGVNATWDVIKGSEEFFNVTKAFHNALHGSGNEITDEMFRIFRETTNDNLETMNLYGDVILVHDPQPAGLIAKKKELGKKWAWRCHIDVSQPNTKLWEFLREYVVQYDASIFSMPDFSQELPIPQYLIAPSIDPLAEKNKELDQSYIDEVVQGYGIDPERPLITQISRFDRLKDPIGVIEAYRIVKKRYDIQLVLAGGGASDDPEGAAVLQESQEMAAEDPDIKILLLPPFSDREINALQRASTAVLQKSLKEGFGLTVTEALWKKKPVIAGATGGIRKQIIDGVTGYLVHTVEGTARRIIDVLNDPKNAEQMAKNGFEHVRNNFLLTRHLKDYLLVMIALEHDSVSDVIEL
jgi:trehalose synthase